MSLPAPFGLFFGMQLIDFQGEKPIEIAPFKYRIDAPPKPHPLFDFYVLQITPRNGLSWIKAIGKDIQTNSFGSSVATAFKEMEEKLKKAYGNAETIDLLLHDSIWNEPRDWMTALTKRERLLFSTWNKETGANLTEAIESIFLGANGSGDDTGYISLEYTLKNNDAAEQEISAAQDDVL